MLTGSTGSTQVPIELQHAVVGCPQLPKVVVVDLVANATYRLVLGPNPSETSVAVVMEKLSDFETAYYLDSDGDSFGDPSDSLLTACTAPAGRVANDTDCDDAVAAVNPGASEICDSLDNNCDGSTDEDYVPAATSCGVGACAGTGTTTCVAGAVVDSCVAGTPAASDATCNGIDEDCSGTADEDYVSTATSCGVGACAGTGTTTCVAGAVVDSCVAGTPAASDATCNGIDEDCSGAADEDYASAATSCGMGACAATGALTCVAGAVVDSCVAGTPVAEVCDGADNDCDGQVDEAGAGGEQTYYADADGDGYGNAAVAVVACTEPAGYIADGTDCDDAQAAVNPGTEEICDGLDNNCDGTADNLPDPVDEVVEHACLHAQYGPFVGVTAVAVGAGPGPDVSEEHRAFTVALPGTGGSHEGEATFEADEENDFAFMVSPDMPVRVLDGTGAEMAVEVDQATQGCSALARVRVLELGVGSYRVVFGPTESATALLVIEEMSHRHEGEEGEEGEHGQDFHRDADGDGYGNPEEHVLACTAPAGYVEDESDCDDGNAAVHPGLSDGCDAVDNDCDGTVDEDATLSQFYPDADNDGFGAAPTPVPACVAPPGHVANAADCNDADATVSPAATEICDTQDNDCDGQTDEPGASGEQTSHPDVDGDGHGAPGGGVVACTAPAGRVLTSDDCNDASAAVHPGAQEICDGIDNDCNGVTDSVNGASVCHCTPVVLDASKSYQPSVWTDGQQTFTAPRQIRMPSAIEVVSGNAGNHKAFLWIRDVLTGVTAKCTYQGGSSQAHPNSEAQRALGLRYLFKSCDSGARAGDVMEIDYARLRVDNGSSQYGTTRIRATLAGTFYRDADGDGYGYGNPSDSVQSCVQPAGYVSDSRDCNDTTAEVRPGAAEICDGLDNDCDGQVDAICGGSVCDCSLVTVEATRSYNPTVQTDGLQSLSPPRHVAVPGELTVVQGNAGNKLSYLWLRDANTGTNRKCTYQGGSSQANPSTEAERIKGLKYLFKRCTGGLTVGAATVINQLQLQVAGGASSYGTTRVRAELPNPSCN